MPTSAAICLRDLTRECRALVARFGWRAQDGDKSSPHIFGDDAGVRRPQLRAKLPSSRRSERGREFALVLIAHPDKATLENARAPWGVRASPRHRLSNDSEKTFN
jgi:hypothetical protein